MTSYRASSTQVITEFDTDAKAGLTSAEAAQRIERFGPNELRSSESDPLWKRILRQFNDPLVYLLIVAMLISMAAWWFEGRSGWPVDATVIAIILLANAAIGFSQEQKAADAVAALADMTQATCTVLRAGAQQQLPSSQLVPGDILLLSEGDTVGADARLLTASALTVQEASLTGESVPSVKDPGDITEEVPLGDRHNMVFKGTFVFQGVGTAVVTATGMDTEMGSIADMLDRTEQDESPLEREIAKVSKLLGVLVIAIAVVVMATLAFITEITSAQDVVDILLLGVSLAVAAVPEGLPAILSLVLAIGVQALARRNAVMKSLHSVETLGAASVICSDKTGTLTRNEMTLRSIVTASGTTTLDGIGYSPTGSSTSRNDDSAAEARTLLAAGCIANNASLTTSDSGEPDIVGDPTEAAFLVAWPKLSQDSVADVERIAENPFTSDRKMMSVVVRNSNASSNDQPALTMYAKGAPDVLLRRCVAELSASGVAELAQERRQAWEATVEELSRDGYRTLGVAMKQVPDTARSAADSEYSEEGLVFLGVVGIIDPPRTEAAEAIEQAHGAGIRTIMITGDHPVTAQRIASDLGIFSEGHRTVAVTGQELDAMSAEEFNETVLTTDVYARVAPAHKLNIVDALQAHGHVVSMTGDGVNDAPALKSADIGVAMGITGTEVSKEAATMILADDNYATIVSAVRQGRGIFSNIRKFLRYLLSSNMGEVITVFAGVALAAVFGLREPGSENVILPLLATQILWINLVTDSGPALAMGVDPIDDDIMTRAPRDPKRAIIDADMWKRIIFIGLVMGFATLLTIDIFLPDGLIAGTDSIEVARTAGFTTLVFAQLFNALNSRSAHASAFHHLGTNGWLWGSIALAVAMQVAVVHVPFLQVAFGTAALDAAHWGVAIGMASLVLWFEEIAKVAYRMAHKRNSHKPAA
ncbi:cation-translocating P-type ATPase [Corynebacterium sp. H78]|uniref:cation-translocating P-type ATPase n=1 Tax=Corynebacterium sp. H78 TaxID=3133417 RepID=UPI0030A5ACDF